MTDDDNVKPGPAGTIHRSIQVDASVADAYVALKNLLSCSATFMMSQWDDAKRTVSFSSFDGVECVASISALGDGCEVEIVSDASDGDLAQRQIDNFIHDYQAQINMAKIQRSSESKIRPESGPGSDLRKTLDGARERLGAPRTMTSSGIAQRTRGMSLAPKFVVGAILFVLLIVFACAIGSCGGSGSTPHDGKISVPESSDSFEDDNYKDVVDRLKSAGFTNVKTEGLGDLITGFLHKEGEVKEVSVGGDVDYSTSDRFSPSVKIVVRYHSYPADDDSSGKTESQDATANPSSGNQDEADGDSSSESSSESSTEVRGTITAQNNQEFAQLLAGNDSSQAVGNFANKYQGKEIEFDGYTAAVTHHDSYKTRFDYLILAGDAGNTQSPNFHFSNVNYYDLHLKGGNIPDSFTTNLNIHVIAKIKNYDSASDLLELEPVSITMR